MAILARDNSADILCAVLSVTEYEAWGYLVCVFLNQSCLLGFSPLTAFNLLR